MRRRPAAAPVGMLTIRLCDEDLVLLSSGAVWLQAYSALLVADAHLGKAHSFRRLGVPVPAGTTDAVLQAISDDLARTGAQRLVFLGDLLHSARGRSQALLHTLADWRARHADCAMTLVRGNHDDRAGDPPASLAIDAVDEPFCLGPFALCHHPQSVASAYVLAGHWHPCVTLRGAAHDRLRLPCFWFGAERVHAVGVLPAFGEFTGMHPIDQRDGDRVYAIAGDVVRQVSA